jgi:polyisoprenyl-phosphate glycosyltransferase
MNAQDKYISIVSPVYQAEENVDELIKRINEEVSHITNNYEIILVEDGSKDESWKKIESACKIDERIIGVKLSRNFGQHYAITAGLSISGGMHVIVMDCDLQDNPKYIKALHKKALEGYDIVYTIKKSREHSSVKNILASIYHRSFNWLVGNKSLHSNGQIGSYSLLSRKVVNAFISFNDYHRHYLSILRWLGFSETYIVYEHEKRYSGKSSYTFSKLFTHAINGLIAQTDKLLRISTYIGFLFSTIGFIAIIYIVLISLKNGFQPGWASTTVLVIFSTGLILSSLGVVGIIIGKIFEQAKSRPLFIIDKLIRAKK